MPTEPFVVENDPTAPRIGTYKPKKRCAVCTAVGDNKYNGKNWCDDHFQQRMAMETQ